MDKLEEFDEDSDPNDNLYNRKLVEAFSNEDDISLG